MVRILIKFQIQLKYCHWQCQYDGHQVTGHTILQHHVDGLVQDCSNSSANGISTGVTAVLH